LSPSDKQYNAKWKTVVNVLTNQGLKISRVAKTGSRAKQSHHSASDMDVIFAVASDPKPVDFYPELEKVLNNNFGKVAKVRIGSNNNVVHLSFLNGMEFELKLLKEHSFDVTFEDILRYKKKRL